MLAIVRNNGDRKVLKLEVGSGGVGGGLSNAYAFMTNGADTITAVGSDTVKLRTANNILSLGLGNDDITHGDNVLFTINQANINLAQSQVANLPTDLAALTPKTRNITINGVTQNLTADRTWNVPDTNFGNTDIVSTGNRTHDGDGYSLFLNNYDWIQIASKDSTTDVNFTYLYANGSSIYIEAVDSGDTSRVIAQNSVASGGSAIILSNTSSVIKIPFFSLFSNETDQMVVWDSVSKRIGYRAIPAGGSGGGDITDGSNLGGGLSNFDSKSGTTLRFNTFDGADFDLSSNLISIDSIKKGNWDTAFTWGNHATVGYLTSQNNDVRNQFTAPQTADFYITGYGALSRLYVGDFIDISKNYGASNGLVMNDSSGGYFRIGGGSSGSFLPYVQIRPFGASQHVWFRTETDDSVGYSTPAMLMDSAKAAGQLVNQDVFGISSSLDLKMLVKASGQIQMHYYGDGTFEGTATRIAAWTSTGLLIEVDPESLAGITNGYTSISDGTNTANASGSDNIKFRSANNILSVLVGSNDVTHGDNVLFTINQSNISLAQSQVTNLTTDLSNKVTSNAAITGATKTKITYDAKGLVTAGADATTADIGESGNLYFTEARVRASVLTGLSVATTTDVVATDSVLVAIGKLQGQLDSISGGGTVTTFSSGNLSPLFTTSVSNAGTTPALSFALVNQNANLVYASPSSGGAAAPSFRSLVNADIPTGITMSKISWTGTTAQYVRGDGSTATFPTNVSSFSNDSGYKTTFGTLAQVLAAGNSSTADLQLTGATSTLSSALLKLGNGVVSAIFDPAGLSGSDRTYTFPNASGTFMLQNSSITGATKTKITYDARGLVTAGADATTADISESGNLYFTEARVRTTPLTGLSLATSTDVVATDNVLQAIGKLQAQIDAIPAGGTYVDLPAISLPSAPASGIRLWTTSNSTFSIIAATTSRVYSFDYSSVTANRSWTLPDENTVLAGTTATQLLTNKAVSHSAGTTTQAPMSFTSGVLLTAATAGAWEYDGKAFYATPAGTNRGVVPAMQTICLQAVRALASANTVQSVFNVGVTLQAATTYRFEAYYYLSTGTTTHTTATLFGGTATLTNILYDATLVSAAASTIATATSNVEVIVATAKVLNATSTAATTKIFLMGVVRVNAGGTFIPQIQFSAAPTGTNQVNINSWFSIWPIGSNTVNAIGAWA